jgi:hypothetical protein
MGKIRNAYSVLIRNLRGRVHFGDFGVIERVILKWVLKESFAILL